MDTPAESPRHPSSTDPAGRTRVVPITLAATVTRTTSCRRTAGCAQIRHLERLLDWLGAGSHPLIKIVQLALLWPLQVALGIELWRRKAGTHIGDWIAALGEFEALSALAALAFEHPNWIFPDLLTPTHASFTAKSLRHPLIDPQRCVPNDVKLDGAPRPLIVSGSNMSGKSTIHTPSA